MRNTIIIFRNISIFFIIEGSKLTSAFSNNIFISNKNMGITKNKNKYRNTLLKGTLKYSLGK